MALYGGLGQFIAGIFSFWARDNITLVIHTAWGSYFLAFGIESLLVVTGHLPAAGRYEADSAKAMWFVCLAAITWLVFLASCGRDFLTAVLSFFLAAGATVLFAGLFAGSRGCIKAAGYLLMLASLTALARVAQWLSQDAFFENFVPNIKSRFEKRQPLVRIPIGEPGVKKGQ